MTETVLHEKINELLAELVGSSSAPLDLLPRRDMVEKVVELALSGPPPGPPDKTEGLARLAEQLEGFDTSELKLVVFGGGTGLSNLVGGDSRHPAWQQEPFHGLKEIFPKTRSIVCVTDDGGSTGELQKDLDLVAIGDLRHVLLSSVRLEKLRKQYGLSDEKSQIVAAELYRLFNYRFDSTPEDSGSLLKAAGVDPAKLPVAMIARLLDLVEALFNDPRLSILLQRPHCLGNLLLVSAICRESADENFALDQEALMSGLSFLADLLGADAGAVLPCSVTPSLLKVLYTNGVMVCGEYKSGHARRGCPVDRAFVESCGKPVVAPVVLESIREADIIIFAPGSLYTSIIPILQLEEITAAVRGNSSALKLLVTNLWVQKGETDLVACASGRRFHVSDLISAYHRNIPGGIGGLFHELMVLGLHDIPGSILQSYALEDKVPIYLDRERVQAMRLQPVECRIFSSKALEEKRVVQHDPRAMAKAVRAVWAVRDHLLIGGPPPPLTDQGRTGVVAGPTDYTPARRLQEVREHLEKLDIDSRVRKRITDIIWHHRDISIAHLQFFAGVLLVDSPAWSHSQEWDRIYSYYDPVDELIKIRLDVFADPDRFELAFLVALGEALLGDYAAAKEMLPVENRHGPLGRIYQITLRDSENRRCFFDSEGLHEYLALSRMTRSLTDPLIYTRLVTGAEGFTPPGLLFGLLYAWYLDNRFTAHIEYKMAILRMEVPDMIPEQAKISNRRQRLVRFFRRRVFGHDDPRFDALESGSSG